jgi:hypothetical protein
MKTAMSATGSTKQSEALVQGLVRVLETGEGGAENFAPAALFDLNVPAWRFQVRGADAFNEWWHEEVAHRGRVTVGRSAPTPSGFVLETAIEFEHDGKGLYARQMCLAEVSDGRIVELAVYCTGDWDAQTRAKQAREAPMIRP